LFLSIRITLLWLVVLGLAVYSWRDWYRSLCGLIALTGIINHPDFPSFISGIQGANPWSLLFSAILLSWLLHRRQEGLRFDVPPIAIAAIGLYMVVLLFTFFTGLADIRSLPKGFEMSPLEFTADYLINPLKWLLAGFLLYDGCRNQERLRWAAMALVLLWVLLALQVIKSVPLTALLHSEVLAHMRIRLVRETAYSATDLAMIMAGAFWAVFSLSMVFKEKYLRRIILGGTPLILLALALTGARAGCMAFLVTGMLMGLFRWRWLLVIIPGGVLAAALLFPGLTGRLSFGFGEKDLTGQETIDKDKMTSGRSTVIWPLVWKQFGKSPAFGEGRRAMPRKVSLSQIQELDPTAVHCYGHPHNMYFEILLEGGVIGLILVLPLHLGTAGIGLSLFRRRGNDFLTAVGGAAAACVTANMIAGLGSQSFLPKLSMVGLFCTAGLALRMWAWKRQVQGHYDETSHGG
jgi:O-antigen ligase